MPDPICEAGEKGVLLGTKIRRMPYGRHENAQKGQKNGQKVLYKHINSWGPAPCLRLAGAGYNMQGLGQAAEDPLRVKGTLKKGASRIVFGGKGGVGLLNDSACANKLHILQDC